MKKRDAYHPDYLKIYPCLKDRPDILKFLRQCDRKQEYLEYDLKVNRTRTNKRTMETVIWPQRELSYEHLLEEHQFAQQETSPEETLLHEIELENLRCAVERLPNDERLLLHLRYPFARHGSVPGTSGLRANLARGSKLLAATAFSVAALFQVAASCTAVSAATARAGDLFHHLFIGAVGKVHSSSSVSSSVSISP